MVVELRPATGTERGLVSALQLPRRHDPGPHRARRASWTWTTPPRSWPQLDADLLEDVYRIVAEALHNSVKHAAAARVAIQLSVASHGSRRRLVAEVTDDGRGLDGGTRRRAAARRPAAWA